MEQDANKYIKILDSIQVNDILDELSNCPEEAWRELDEWVNPRLDKIYHLFKTGQITDRDQLQARIARAKMAIDTPDTSREQDRLHLIWQFLPSDKDNTGPWWINNDWHNWTPAVHPKYGKLFPNTISQMQNYWKSRGKSLSRMFFSRLMPGKQVYPHVDGKWGENYDNNQRYGLVITTNSQCNLTVGPIIVNPGPGTLYWFDSREIHSATNPLPADNSRIFLYMDVDQN